MNIKGRITKLEASKPKAANVQTWIRLIADPAIPGHAEQAEAEAALQLAAGRNVIIRRIVSPENASPDPPQSGREG